MKRPLHFWLIVIATAILLWKLIFAWSPGDRMIDGDAAFRALVWTKHVAGLIEALGLYLAFCVVVLGHAVCTTGSEAKTGKLDS